MSHITQNRYKIVEKKFFDFINKNLKNDLLFYAVTGSMSRGDIIPDWSDIDILIVVKKYNKKIFSVISEALSGNASNIKIGLTFFSYDDFINKKLCKDPKTLYSIDLIDQGICKPKIFNQKIKKNILKIKHQKFSLWYDTASLVNILHGYKHALLPIVGYDEKKVFKSLSTLLKIILKQKGIVAHGYDEVFKLSKNKLKGFDMKFKKPIYIMKNQETFHERYGEYIRFLNWLKKYPNF